MHYNRYYVHQSCGGISNENLEDINILILYNTIYNVLKHGFPWVLGYVYRIMDFQSEFPVICLICQIRHVYFS